METDPLLEEAKKISLEAGKVSVSWIQRKLRIGYVRAARIMDALTKQGFCEAEFCNEIVGRRIIAAPNIVCTGLATPDSDGGLAQNASR